MKLGVNISQKVVPLGYGIVLKFGKVLLISKKIIQWKSFEISKKGTE